MNIDLTKLDPLLKDLEQKAIDKLNEKIELGEEGQIYLTRLTEIVKKAIYQKLEPEIQILAGKISISRIQQILADNGVFLNLTELQRVLTDNKAVIENGFIKFWQLISGYQFSHSWQKWCLRIGLIIIAFIIAYLMGEPLEVLEWLNKVK